MTSNRIWAVALAALLVGSGAVVFATQVQGQEFEHRGEIEAATAAYELDWREDPGKLRLALSPADGAVSPAAQLSLFNPDGVHLGTYALDDAFGTLDYIVEDRGEYTLVVHRAVEADVSVLSERGHDIELTRTELVTTEIELVEGEHTSLAHQVALDRDQRDAHMSLALDGTATGLVVEALNADGETVLEAQAAEIDTSQDQILVPELTPEAFSQGSLLVRVSAESFNGSLALELATIETTADHVITISSHSEDEEENDEEPTSEENETSPEPDAEAEVERTRVTELAPGVPVAFDVPEGVDHVYIVGQDRCGVGVLFSPSDEILGAVPFDEDEAAYTEENGSWAAMAIPTDGAGEHVAMVVDTHDPGYLVIPGAFESVDHRELEIAEINGTLEGESGLLTRSSATTTAELPGGLLGFKWRSQGLSVDREVRLVSPNNETVYDAHGISAAGYTVFSGGFGHSDLLGPDGLYTIETEGSSTFDGRVSFELAHYVR